MPKSVHLHIDAAVAVHAGGCAPHVVLDLREQEGCRIQVEERVTDVVVAHGPHDLHSPQGMPASGDMAAWRDDCLAPLSFAPCSTCKQDVEVRQPAAGLCTQHSHNFEGDAAVADDHDPPGCL